MNAQKSQWAYSETLRLALAEPIVAEASTVGGDIPIGGASGYDAARDTSARSVLTFPLNSYTETNKQTRQRLVEKVRSLDANLSIISRITKKAAQHAVGKGLFVQPTTQDKEWNMLAKALFEEWCGSPGVYSIDASRDHYEDQRMVAETMLADGEFFMALVNSPGGAPMVQALDVMEIDQPWGAPSIKSLAGWTDGVRVNDYGRPVSYSVREMLRPGQYQSPNFRFVPSDNMLHVYQRKRAKQLRGMTWFYSGINQGIDALDLRALITGTAKLHSGLAVTVKGAGAVKRRGALSAIRSETDGTDTRGLENVYGGGIISYLGTEGEVKLHSSDHPGENLQEFIKFLYADIAAAVGVPYSTVSTLAPLGGASVRGELEDAQWLFEMIQDKIIWGHSFPIYRWRMAKAVKEGRIRPCRDPKWWACSFRGPAKLTVDIGRTADANIKLIRNGALSYSRYYEERGLNVREEWTEQMDNLEWLQQECDRRGVPIDWFIEKAPGTVNQINMPEQSK